MSRNEQTEMNKWKSQGNLEKQDIALAFF